MKGGAVVDLAEAEQAIRHAVDARRAHGQGAGRIGHLSLSAGRLGSELFAADVDVAGRDA